MMNEKFLRFLVVSVIGLFIATAGCVHDKDKASKSKESDTPKPVYPDLVAITIAPPNARTGSTFTVTNITSNVGQAISQNCQDWNYLSTSCTTSATKCTSPVSPMNIGQSYTNTCKLTVPIAMPFGTNYVFTIANGNHACVETNWSNNNNCIPINITP